ncbi:hypothetical protein D3C72_1930800 [compost metagenome]
MGTVGLHEKKRVFDIAPLCQAHDLAAHQAEHEGQEDVQAFGPGERSIQWANERDNLASGSEDGQGFFNRIPPYGSEHRVVVAQHGLEILRLVVHNLVRPQSAHQVNVACTGGGAHLCPEVFGQLDCERTDTARPSRNEHLLPGLKLEALFQRLP